MEVATILTIVVLSILLPTLDVYSDVNLMLLSFASLISLSLFHLPSVILTGLFLHLDRLCCCCPCTGVPGEEISVYDPSTDKRLILVNSELVEPPEDDVETGDTPSSSCYGCCSPVQEQNTEDVALTVGNKA